MSYSSHTTPGKYQKILKCLANPATIAKTLFRLEHRHKVPAPEALLLEKEGPEVQESECELVLYSVYSLVPFIQWLLLPPGMPVESEARKTP